MKRFVNLKISVKILSYFIFLMILAGVVFAGLIYIQYQLKNHTAHAAGAAGGAMTAMIVIVGIAILSFPVFGIVLSRSISKPLNKLVCGAKRLAEGDTGVSFDAGAGDETGELAAALASVSGSLDSMVRDAELLSRAAAAGDLSERADPSRHPGDFRKIVEGYNAALDSIVTPVNEVVAVLGKTCVNDLTVKVQGAYSGDMKALASAVNEIIERTVSTQEVFEALSRGDMSELEKYEAIGRRSENDRMIPAVVKTMRTLNGLVGDADALMRSVAEGDLAARGNASKYEGKYRLLIDGINRIMEAIAAPLDEAAGVLDAMARNDFTSAMSEGYKGSFAALSMSVNSVLETLNQMLSDINAAAEQVTAGTRQVSSGSQALSQGATEQASAIEQLNATVEEIASQTKQNAVNATQASDLATTAKNDAVSGDTLMKELQQAMGEINEASANISKIIKVIDDIAFQTNLLALNAAVEAARAGQHGKGFAVVAEEVRNLAQRSAGAARETTEMIEESIRKAKAGTKIANETAQALNRIVEGVEKATGLIGGIARASSDQATAVSQVNRGIVQVSQVTQTNSATAEESAAASEELSSQAAMLKQMVERFSLRDAARAQGDTTDFLPGRNGAARNHLSGGRHGMVR
jgi:methyl-accepting chemotaxis protein